MRPQNVRSKIMSNRRAESSVGSALRNHQGALQPAGFPGLPEGWESRSEAFESSTPGLKLFAAIHRRNGGGNRVLIVSHGLGEHGGRYLHFAHYLRDAVDEVYCLDHRGHGRSEGTRGHVERFDELSEDLAHAIKRVHDRVQAEGREPVLHLFGHSLGGLIALKAALDHPRLPLRTLTLSSPLLGVKMAVPLPKRLVGNLLSRVWGSVQIPSGIDASGLSHDPAVVEAYLADRLVHDKVTPRLFTEMTAAYQATRARDKGLRVPLQMMLPEEDPVTDTDLAKRWFEALKTSKQGEKNLVTYPGFFHESFNETGKERAFEDLESWVRRHNN